LSWGRGIEVPVHIEVIGKKAFQSCFLETVNFASGSTLTEIGEEAFSQSYGFGTVTVPASVEILGDRCFEYCCDLATVTFEEKSRLRKIGEGAFASSRIRSITIPASVDEMDGSAFAHCRLEAIDIAAGNRRFIIRGNTLLTSDGTEIVRFFGFEREIIVPMEVEVLQKSCFASLECLEEVIFENESKLRRIDRSALFGCASLMRILLPASLSEIGEFAFTYCIGLEDCSIQETAMLVEIGREAFMKCCSLRSFYVPKNVERIGKDCFRKCPSLAGLRFGSGGTLKRIVTEKTLDEALEHLGITEISSVFRIEIDEDGSDLAFPGWIAVSDAGSHLTILLF
jgi:hypothetical protein